MFVFTSSNIRLGGAISVARQQDSEKPDVVRFVVTHADTLATESFASPEEFNARFSELTDELESQKVIDRKSSSAAQVAAARLAREMAGPGPATKPKKTDSPAA